MLLMSLALCVGACGCSGMNIHLSHNTNKDIDSPLQYTVCYKKAISSPSPTLGKA